jgi:hypothetical protein
VNGIVIHGYIRLSDIKLLCLPFTFPTDCPHEPVGAFVGGICYWLNTDAPTTFFGARKRCRGEGGDLAVIPDQAVLDALWAGVTTR